ncbi:MAG: hypothetical protein N2246_02280 [Candidatus Sumerlaeia bacterium]|nr:hypothetical protein [Candidatus Sumerlaeia bacterium]
MNKVILIVVMIGLIGFVYVIAIGGKETKADVNKNEQKVKEKITLNQLPEPAQKVVGKYGSFKEARKVKKGHHLYYEVKVNQGDKVKKLKFDENGNLMNKKCEKGVCKVATYLSNKFKNK